MFGQETAKAEFHLLSKGEGLAKSMANAGACYARGDMKAHSAIFAGMRRSSGEPKHPVPHRAGIRRLRRIPKNSGADRISGLFRGLRVGRASPSQLQGRTAGGFPGKVAISSNS